jgi:type I restriction enzyme S subunit
MSLRETSLGEICEFRYGKGLPANDRRSGPFKVFGSNGAVGEHDEAITEGPTIIVGRKGSIGEVTYHPESCWPIDTTYFVDASCTRADLKWLARQLDALNLRSMNKAAAVPGLNREDAYQKRLIVPPLPEQRRIAAILDAADALRQKRRQALRLLDQLSQAIFIEMFGRLASTSCEPLAEVCELITDGTHYTPTYVEKGVTFLSAKNVVGRKINWEDTKDIPQDLHLELQKRVSPRRGDVLLAKNGTTGVAAVVDQDRVFDIYVSLALLRPGPRIRTLYLWAALNSDSCRRQFTASLKGIGVPNLHLKDIRSARISIPPVKEQDRFIDQLSSVQRLGLRVGRSLQALDALFASLQHRAFRGEL